ncbi:MAG: hypothetical protein WC894_03225 [Patescibacteria group bacterium]
MEKEITKVLKYFAIFAYHPTLDEIHTFLRVKTNKQKLKYTPPQYSIKEVKNLELKIKNSENKLNNWRFRAYIKLISIFPQIKLVGLSGSISMMNATEDDDIDLFIITAKNRLFTGRLIALVLAQILGLRRSRERFRDSATQIFHKNKVCLNLFFDESNLKVPKFKQTEFVGHEVLQMKPIIVKDNIYERFLEANRWVYELFPNGKSKSQILNLKSQIKLKRFKFKILNLFGTWNLGFRIFNKVESLLKKLQLTLINRHRTTEVVTSSQLWFHPDDFEKKIRKTL